MSSGSATTFWLTADVRYLFTLVPPQQATDPADVVAFDAGSLYGKFFIDRSLTLLNGAVVASRSAGVAKPADSTAHDEHRQNGGQ